MSKRRTEKLLEDLIECRDRYAAHRVGDPYVVDLIRRLAEIVDDLETLEADRQEHLNQ